MLGDGAEVRGSSAGVSGETSLGALGGGASNRVVLGSLADDGVEQLDPTTKAVAAQIAVILLVVIRRFLSCSVQSAGSVPHRKDWSGIRGPKASESLASYWTILLLGHFALFLVEHPLFCWPGGESIEATLVRLLRVPGLAPFVP